MALAEQVGGRLVARGETVAIAESSAGGLISAALLSVGGASRYFRGGAVVYTKDAKMSFLHLDETTVTEPRAATEKHALVLARGVRDVMGATWGVGETGATGPTGNRYGDAPGHACIAVAGPPGARRQQRADTIETGHADRPTNMETFAWAALSLLNDMLGPDEAGRSS
jgi:nicotinamide-nucleotide amidase